MLEDRNVANRIIGSSSSIKGPIRVRIRVLNFLVIDDNRLVRQLQIRLSTVADFRQETGEILVRNSASRTTCDASVVEIVKARFA